ncbi:uncharacterized protein ISCGN_018984 [Ixodes scapularis]
MHPPSSTVPDFDFDDSAHGTCPPSEFGQCLVSSYEHWDDSRHAYGVQKVQRVSDDWGRGAGTIMAVPLTQFLLFVQVGDNLTSRSRFYVFLLPVPPHVVFATAKSRNVTCRVRRRFVLMRSYAFYFLLLLLCGDIELNPGPDTAATLQILLDGQNAIKAKLQTIETNQEQSKATLDDLKTRIESLEQHLAQFSEMKAAVTDCRKQCEDTHSVVRNLTAKVDDLENRSRRCNLIFYGVPDTDTRELPAASEKRVQEIVTRLGLEPVQIERAHRLGRYSIGKARPLIANFALFKEKQTILSNAKKLKGTTISISEDFSEAVRRKRKQLWDFAKDHRNDNTRVNLRYDALYLNDTRYIYDEALGQVVQST